MAKSEVYSWRLTPRLKIALEDAARRRGQSIAGLLEEISKAWLAEQRRLHADDEREQERRRRAAKKWVGSIDSGDSHLSERVSEVVGEEIAKAHDRTQRAR